MVNFRLKEIVLSIASGITINHSSKGTYPVYGSTGIIGYTNANDYSGERILIARVGANAVATNIVCVEYGVSDNTLVITVDSEYETKYIYYFLKHKKLNQFVFGSGQPLITGSLLKNISLYIPDRISQQHIAEALSDVDGMISSLEKLVAKYKSIKTACLQQMFPQNGETVPRMRLPGFTGAWKQRKLGDIGKARSGVGFPDAEQGGVTGIPFFKVSDMNLGGNENEMTVANNYVTAEQIAVHRWSPITELPAIFFAKVGAAVMLNRKRLCRFPFLLDNNTMAYSLSPTKWDADFAKALFGTVDLTSLVQVGALPSYNARDVESMGIYLPSLLEQEQIGAFFKQLDHLITLHQRKLDKAKKIKQGMMQQLLTGKIRLNN